MLERRQQAGARVIGKKIGVTSKAVMNMLNVHQPDFGYLTDDMVFNSGEAVPISDRLIAPRAEGEIAFILKKDLTGPGVTNADVLAATECVIDRKSTRLNSSHVRSSYAVFCFKKKRFACLEIIAV